MPNSEAHIPALTDMTETFNAIVAPATTDGTTTDTPVKAGELSHVATFDPAELPIGAHLIPKDPTNPNVQRIAANEAHPEARDEQTAARVGYISLNPFAPSIIHLRTPSGEDHRIFSVLPAQQVIEHFRGMGYQLTNAVTDLPPSDTRARHELSESVTTEMQTQITKPMAPEPAPQAIPAVPESASDNPRSWFESYKPPVYEETDQVVTGSHHQSIREVLAGAANEADLEAPVGQSAKMVEFKPADWRAVRREQLNQEPLPLSEQLAGIKNAMIAAGPLLSRQYHLTPAQVEAAFKEVNDTTRWQALFPDSEAYQPNQPAFEAFDAETTAIIRLALKETMDLAPRKAGIAALAGRPRQELSVVENAQLDKMRWLQQIVPIVKAVKDNPTILTTYAEAESYMPKERNNGSGHTKLMPKPGQYFDTTPERSRTDQTRIMKAPITKRAFAWAAQKSVQLAGRGMTKLKSLYANRRQSVSV